MAGDISINKLPELSESKDYNSNNNSNGPTQKKERKKEK